MASGGGLAPNPNTIPVIYPAISTVCAYPLGKIRKDMNSQEYNQYKYDWNMFNRVWSYNYTISTLNGQGASYTYWTYTNFKDRTSYINGQESHVTFYSNIPPEQFANINGS